MIKDKLLPVAQLISKITNQFYLAGGTAIMLKYDHRESYDLDFFYGKSFSFKRMENKIKKRVTGISHIAYGEDNLDIFIEGTKVSFVFFPFSNVKSNENSTSKISLSLLPGSKSNKEILSLWKKRSY